ncbi:MAG: ATP-dependent Clp protease ATP-binding subunit ClpX [Eubacteriales bacterium]|nr:ATP-dependent Clp protease ATP-binding subunit ClpX [Eubacteriales bacterium]
MSKENDNEIEKPTGSDKQEASDKDKKQGHKQHYCSMCHREEKVTGRQIRIMDSMYICADCLEKGMHIIGDGHAATGQPFNPFTNVTEIFDAPPGAMEQEEESAAEERPPAPKLSEVMKPHEIKHALDEYVIGQEQAKKVVAVATYNHYKRVASDTMKVVDDVEVDKSNILMIGPTGSGKTYLVKTLAKLLDVPLAMTDATSLTEAGYIGDDIESVLSKLLAEADNDLEKAERGIVFIDEIDKIAKKRDAHARDVSGESVQQGLLKLLEGNRVEVPVGATSKNALAPLRSMDTTNILFIVGGAFPGLEEIVKERMQRKTTIGFNAESKSGEETSYLMHATAEDLRKYGMIPEFLGRLPVVVHLHELTEDMLVSIIREPRNAIIKQYQKLFALDDVKLSFEDEALAVICKRAMSKETGARALRSVIEEILLDIMFEVPKDGNIGEVVITADYVAGHGAPVIRMRGAGND